MVSGSVRAVLVAIVARAKKVGAAGRRARWVCVFDIYHGRCGFCPVRFDSCCWMKWRVWKGTCVDGYSALWEWGVDA